MDFMFLSIIFSTLCGFLLATFIHFKKRGRKPLVCPIGHLCDPVVRSDYSRLLGIPVEVLGMLYYLLILLCYSLFLIFPVLKESGLGSILVGISALAFLFSLYLTAVQAFILREWCTWCLISATLCAIIFFTGLGLSGMSLPSLFTSASFLAANSYKL